MTKNGIRAKIHDVNFCVRSFLQEYRYHDMHSPMLEDPDFDGKPLVMLIGQYSTGKTTFIRWREKDVFLVFVCSYFSYLVCVWPSTTFEPGICWRRTSQACGLVLNQPLTTSTL